MSERARFQRVDALFEAALQVPPDEHPAYLAQACGDDDALRREVEELLRYAEPAKALLGEHVGSFAAPLVADLAGVLDADPAVHGRYTARPLAHHAGGRPGRHGRGLSR